MQVLAHFRPIKKNVPNILNSREEKLRCEYFIKNFRSSITSWMKYVLIKFLFILVAFKMYDLDNDDMISKDELLAILHMMVGANIR